MFKLTTLFTKSVLVALAVILTLTALPERSVYAAGFDDPTAPPSQTVQLSNQRLEKIWAKLQQAFERQGQFLDRADAMTGRIQSLLDKMNEKGRDPTALQAALDVYVQALKDAHPIYESAKGIINSHQGFDADGKVTDHNQAIFTLKDLAAKIEKVRRLVGEPGRGLREAIKAFRDAR